MGYSMTYFCLRESIITPLFKKMKTNLSEGDENQQRF